MSWGVDRPTEAPDAQQLVIDLLDAAALMPDGRLVNVVAMYPEGATPEAPELPALTVLDAGSESWAATHERTLVQVTAWAENPSPVKRLAALARGHLIVFRGSREFGAIQPATRTAPVRDPETGYWLCAFTVRVLARTR